MSADMRQFRSKVKTFFRRHGRDLPWRRTRDPYRILVSEVMLQQTQVERVVPYYKAFLKRFPSARALAEAPLFDVLRAWQGLGYNRRAKHLHEAVREIVHVHGGRFPRTIEGLDALPGVGPYTAAAVGAFAWGLPGICIETNIRTVFMHHFFPLRAHVRDSELEALVVQALDTKHPREWYWALMDYGAHLKREGVQINTRSAHYKKQSRFDGSPRQLRGRILALSLASPKRLTPATLARHLSAPRPAVAMQLSALRREGLVS